MSESKRQYENEHPEEYRSRPEPRLDARDVDSEQEFEKRYQRDMENGVEFPVQSENVAAQAIEELETTFLSWNKPLSEEEQLIIDVILGRYTDAGTPLVTFETDSTFNMRVPKVWRRISFERSEQKHS